MPKRVPDDGTTRMSALAINAAIAQARREALIEAIEIAESAQYDAARHRNCDHNQRAVHGARIADEIRARLTGEAANP